MLKNDITETLSEEKKPCTQQGFSFG